MSIINRESNAEREEKSEKAELLQGCKAKQKSSRGESEKNNIGNTSVLKQQKGKPLLAKQCLKTITYFNVSKQRA